MIIQSTNLMQPVTCLVVPCAFLHVDQTRNANNGQKLCEIHLDMQTNRTQPRGIAQRQIKIEKTKTTTQITRKIIRINNNRS